MSTLLALIEIAVVLCALGLLAAGLRVHDAKGAMLIVAALTLIAFVVVPQLDQKPDQD